MKFISYSFLFIVLMLSSFVFSQVDKENSQDETSLPTLIQTNTNYLFNDQYGSALASGKRLVELDSLNSNYNYRYGFALMQTSAFLETPLPYLEIAQQKLKKVPDLVSYKEDAAPYDAIFYYGVAHHRLGNLEKASEAFTTFMSKAGKKNKLYPSAEFFQKQVENALSIRESVDVKSVRLVEKVNTEYPEYSSIISFDGSALYFTSPRPWEDGYSTPDANTGGYIEDIYVCYLKGNQPCVPERLDFCVRTENEASLSISLDERQIYTYSSETGNGDIYYMYYYGGEYQRPYLLENKEVNTDKWQPHYYLSADGKTAIFSSEDEKDGYGGLDLYMMTKQKDGKWSSPVNLGPEINTPYNEDAPFLSFDNRYLYFSSNNEQSIGGYDIFRSEWKGGKFLAPENLGTPINSTYDDLYYTTPADGATAYISSFRKRGFGDMDIYKIEYNTVQTFASVLQGRIYFTNNTDSIPDYVGVNLKCLDCEDTDPQFLYPRLRDGVFMANLEKCKNYELQYIDKNTQEELAVQTLSTTCENKYEEINRELGIKLYDGKIYESIDYVLAGKVMDRTTNEGIPTAKVVVKNEQNEEIATLSTNSTGNFETSVLTDYIKGMSYSVEVDASKHEYVSVTKSIPFTTASEEVVDLGIIYLEKPELGKDLGKMIALNPIYYDFDKWNIRQDAEIELNKVVNAMNENPTMVIELGSHTDCRGNDAYNMRLSQRRAASAADYIRKRIKNGKARISGKGYGESKLIETCDCETECTEEQHQLNRRTEFVIKKF